VTTRGCGGKIEYNLTGVGGKKGIWWLTHRFEPKWKGGISRRPGWVGGGVWGGGGCGCWGGGGGWVGGGGGGWVLGLLWLFVVGWVGGGGARGGGKLTYVFPIVVCLSRSPGVKRVSCPGFVFSGCLAEGLGWRRIELSRNASFSSLCRRQPLKGGEDDLVVQSFRGRGTG